MGKSKILTTKEERILYWLARGLMTNDMNILQMAIEESHNHFVKRKVMKIDKIQDGTTEDGKVKERTQFTMVNAKVNKEMMNELKTWCKARGINLKMEAAPLNESNPEEEKNDATVES